jgi:hypothetical protein
MKQLKAAFEGPLSTVVEPVSELITYDATKLGGKDKAVVNLNTLLLYGGEAAQTAAETNDLDKVKAARDPGINPHLRYADANAWGYGLCTVDKHGVVAELVTVKRSFEPLGDKSPGIRCTARFEIAPVSKPSDIDLSAPAITGQKPFPLG